MPLLLLLQMLQQLQVVARPCQPHLHLQQQLQQLLLLVVKARVAWEQQSMAPWRTTTTYTLRCGMILSPYWTMHL